MALSVPTAAGQKATEGNINYISVVDGTKFVWLIDKSASTTPKTLHDFGLGSPIALAASNHEFECHLEGGKGYSADIANLVDGMYVRLINTSGAAVTDGIVFTGFTKVFDRTNAGAEITAVYPMAKDDWRVVTFTQNGPSWYANITEGKAASSKPPYKPYAGGMVVDVGDPVYYTVGTAKVYLVANTAHTTAATMDAAELDNFDYEGQSFVEGFTPSVLIPKGFQIKEGTIHYQSDTTRTTGATFDAAEELVWLNGDTKPTVHVFDTVPTAASTNPVESKGILASFTTLRTEISGILGVPLADADLGAFPGNAIPDDGTIKASLQALETAIAALKLTGRFVGAASTYAALPTTNPVFGAAGNNDFAILSVADGANKAGFYTYDGAAYQFAAEIAPEFITLTDGQAQSPTDATFGTTSGKQLYDREQAMKGLAAAFLTDNVNHAIARLWDAATLLAELNPKFHDDLAALQLVDTTNLANQTVAYIKATKELVIFEKSATTGDYAPTTGGGFWQRGGGAIASGAVVDFLTNAAANALQRTWSPADLGTALDPLQPADSTALIAIDTTNLRDGREARIKATGEDLYFDKALATGGAYTPTTGGGRWVRMTPAALVIPMGAVLPAVTSTPLFRLVGHSTLPDGLFWNNGSSWAKV